MGVAVIGALGVCAGMLIMARWYRHSEGNGAGIRGAGDPNTESHEPTFAGRPTSVQLSVPAQRNLELISKRLVPDTFWKSIELPGVIEDRPGISDRGVVAPLTGVVAKIHALPGSSVEPNAPLFSIRLVSESLHTSQLELFKASKEIAIARRKHQRLAAVAQSGALAQSRIIDIEDEIERLEVTVEAYRQDLQSRGLTADRIEAAAQGEFITEIVVRAPGEEALRSSHVAQVAYVGADPEQSNFRFEMQSLNVELGQQVDAGQVLCFLADHRELVIAGHGFKDDVPWLQEAARQGWDVDVDFDEAGPGRWPTLPQKLQIQYVANVVDAQSRTFVFYLGLENQWQPYTQDGITRILWRFRPGTRVRLRVPTEKLENVFVVPQAGVEREGANIYVFRQQGNRFERISVHALYEDRLYVVLANDGGIRSGFYIVQNGAAALNRILRSQSADESSSHSHVHADGTVHGAH